MGSLGVVDVAELVELSLERVEVRGEGLAAETLLEGLLEAFDLAGGLRVVGAAGGRSDPGVAQVGLEEDLEPAELA